jgi:hypothetical protein
MAISIIALWLPGVKRFLYSPSDSGKV